jgi:hypothetical protein
MLLERVRHGGLQVSPWYYDVPRTMLRRLALPVPRGAPDDLVVEEPPFVLNPVWRRAQESDLPAKPLVIKAPSNAYRMEFLRALFPNARITVLHLTRNPGAAVNGLFDGWRYHGFHAHRMSQELKITGYADELPDDRWWWKFDLPPGWQEYTQAPLTRVCAFQWRSAHRAILRDTEAGGLDHLRIRFEDLIAGRDSRVRVMSRVARWLGVPFDDGFRRAVLDGIAPVAATASPALRRWVPRAGIIRDSIDDETHAVAEELGYGSEDSWL